MKRILSLLLAVLIFAGMFTACGSESQGTTTQPTEDTAAILQQRRQQVMDAMMQMATVRWTVVEDTPYSLRSESLDVNDDLQNYPDEIVMLKAGTIYQGLPYTHGLGNYHSFADYLSDSADDTGVYTLTINSQKLNGGTATARIGNSCSGAVQMAWSTVATSFIPAKTQLMTLDNNYLKVGEYESDPSVNAETAKVCEQNGVLTMFEAYAQLQMSDAMVRYGTGSGHTVLVSTVHIERNKKGNISGNSYVTIVHQTTGKISHATDAGGDGTAFVDETTGQTIQPFFGVEDKLTFTDLYKQGYLPITCKELVDPAPVAEVTVTDTVTDHSFDTILSGNFRTNGLMQAVTVTVTDGSGNVVQQCTAYAWREQLRDFPLERFTTEDPQVLNGSLDLASLASGTYHCTHVAHLSDGSSVTVRDFDFTVE